MTKMKVLCTTLFLALLALTPLSDAVTTYREWLCQELKPELKQCTLQCPEGKVWRDGCPTCLCRNSLCEQKYCPIGQRCVIKEQEGRFADQFTNVAMCESDDRSQPLPTESVTQEPVTLPLTEFRGSCDYQGRCDANGRCPSQDDVCRADGSCCRIKRDYNMGISTDMAKCMDTPDVGQCRALGTQYVYNKNTGKCQSMMYGGCVNSANSFQTMKICQETCENPCQKPKTPGRCRASIPRYYFNEVTEKCEAYDLGGCAGTANYFMTPWDCEAHCKGLKNNVNRVLTNPTVRPFQQSTPSGHQDDRDTLRQKLIDNYRRQNGFDNRGNPTNVDSGKVKYVTRPQTGQKEYTIDQNGNVIYRPYTTPATNNNNGMYRHLADRVRSANQGSGNFERGQVNYNNLRNRLSGGDTPTYQNRGLSTYTQPTSYQNSVDALRRFLSR